MENKIDILEQAIKALSQADVPDGPSEELLRETLKQVEHENTKTNPFVERIRKMRPLSKFAAAAVVMVAAILSLTLLDKTVAPAYALEQTITACESLRFIHLKCEPAGNGAEEIWAQFDSNGQLERLRMNFPNTDDGPKDVVWQEGKAEVWFKAKNTAAVVREQAMLARLKMSYGDFDPKLIVERLYQLQNDDKVQVKIEEPSSKDEPIVITSTSNGFRDIYKVNPQTRLLLQIEKYEMTNGDDKPLGIIRYLDYNQPAAPDIFVLNLPADVLKVDQTAQNIGLEQGQMTNDEAAVETVRRFWQAVIEEEYDKAGQYLEGVPGVLLKQIFAEKLQIKVIEIVSVGPVQPHPNPQTGGVIVPCTLKVEKDGRIEEMSFDRLGVRQVYNQPGRWTIFGGL
jgi:hypothetical protein